MQCLPEQFFDLEFGYEEKGGCMIYLATLFWIGNNPNLERTYMAKPKKKHHLLLTCDRRTLEDLKVVWCGWIC